MTELKGMNGKIAYINLTTSTIEVKELDAQLIEDYMGGAGLSAKLMYDLLTEEDYEILKNDPLALVNPLIFSTGPLTGTATPSSSRYCVAGISPLTGIWGESTSGGFFPMAFKRCGYDALIITGEAETPKLLYIKDGIIEIKDAGSLWGKNSRETVSALKEILKDDKIRVACIGKGGENLVKYGCIINDEGRAAGRCGLGALMGKKKLKAIAVRGTQKIEYADRDDLVKNGKNVLPTISAAFASNFFSNHGTLCYTDMGMILGDVPAKYFTSTEFIAENLTGAALRENYPVIKYACAGCTIGCGRMTVLEKDGQEIEIDGPEYETTAAFGPLCGIVESFDPILLANHQCNLDGIDTISAGVSIAFLIYLVESKLGIQEISKHLSGINIQDIKWGNPDIMLKLLELIVKREGIGNILADGVRIMAQKFGVDPELAAHVKGLEIPMHDPRAYHGQGLTYMICTIGASHEKGDFFNIDGDSASYRKLTKSDRFNINGREEKVKMMQDIANMYDSAVICNFPHINLGTLARLFKASTGLNGLGNANKLYTASERGNTLKRLIACKLGITRADDKLPKIVTETFKSGGTAEIPINLDENLKNFYKERGWDWETGWPTKEKLEELGIK